MHVQRFDGANFLDPYQQELLVQAQKLSQKQIEPLDFDHTEQGTVKIFNIGPFTKSVPQGGLGTFTIPACPKDRPYSEPLELWKTFPEGRNDDMTKMSLRICDGYAIAESILAYGKFMGGNTKSIFSPDLTQWGMFTCGAYITMEVGGKRTTMLASERIEFMKQCRLNKVTATFVNTRKVTKIAIAAARKCGDTRPEAEISQDILNAHLPTEAELDDANNKLNEYALRLVVLADEFFRGGNPKDITPMMRWAAEWSGNDDKEWLKQVTVKAKCHVCKSPLVEGAALCGQCRTIVPGMEQVIIDSCTPGFERLWDPSHPAHPSHKAPAAEVKQSAATKGGK